MIAAGFLRGFVRYAEQAGNHYIAFKVLALIRQKVFHKLRILSPAKLDQKNKGNLIALITSDVELLEVFYAHTISPIAIALLHSITPVWDFFNHFHVGLWHSLQGFSYAVSGYNSFQYIIVKRDRN
jgi:ATP-binding cassette, subfamily C, bacterial